MTIFNGFGEFEQTITVRSDVTTEGRVFVSLGSKMLGWITERNIGQYGGKRLVYVGFLDNGDPVTGVGSYAEALAAIIARSELV